MVIWTSSLPHAAMTRAVINLDQHEKWMNEARRDATQIEKKSKLSEIVENEKTSRRKHKQTALFNKHARGINENRP